MTRKDPLETTVKKLFVLSGNCCAFPNCIQKMVEDGFVIGVICHIEAAEKGGERYNPNQTDEERRSFANLILLCPTHHTITNNVIKYPVQRLKEMKALHEAKYADTPFVVSDDIVSSAINSYTSTQLIQNLAAGPQINTQSGDIYNVGIGTKDMVFLVETINQSNLVFQDHRRENEAKLTQLKQDLDRIYAESQTGKDIELKLNDFHGMIDVLVNADKKTFDLLWDADGRILELIVRLAEGTTSNVNDTISLIQKLNETNVAAIVKLRDENRFLYKQNVSTRLQFNVTLSIIFLSWFWFKSIDIALIAGIITISVWSAIESIWTFINLRRRRKQKEDLK